MRNAEALDVQPGTGAVWAAIHGRDQLGANWGFSDEANANNPAEELVQVAEGDDFGWPYCYYSNDAQRKVLAPEYGGDGRKVGRCAKAKAPGIAFPATGRRCRWRSIPATASARSTRAGCSSRSTAAGTARRCRRRATAWCSRRSPTASPRAVRDVRHACRRADRLPGRWAAVGKDGALFIGADAEREDLEDA